jgi:NADH:ubiquinone oxidoreductase subunit F (NADH-binding)
VTAMLDTFVPPPRTGPDGSHRLLLAGATTLDDHVRRHGGLPTIGGRQIRSAVAEAGLTGRGGAGFPTHRKLDVVASGRRAVAIGNGAEGEPASRKDRGLLDHAPHLVLDGLQLAARAVDAHETHLYVSSGSVAGLRAALAVRRDPLPVSLHVAPDAFVAGEESAVVNAVGGGPAIPQDKSVRVIERGLRGRPTLVQNVETLAHLALIARYGSEWFRRAGTIDDPGTFLATLTGPVRTPGVYELPYGIRIGDAISAAGGATEPLQALLIGGYHGAWVPARPDVEISRAGLAPYGAAPGAGSVVPLAARSCGLVATAHVVAYLAGQRAGQCGPCVNGLPRIADTFTALAQCRSYPDLVSQVDRLSRLVVGRGACKHPDGTVRLIRSSLRIFAPEVSAHLAGWCTAATSTNDTVTSAS